MATQAFDWKTDRIDNRIVNPDIYTDLDALLADYATLRREDPVHWTAPDGFRPFWAITSHADITTVSKANDIFVNRLRTYLSPIQGEEWVRQMTGDTHIFRTLVDLDNPLHHKLRMITHSWFQPARLRRNLEPRLREIAREHVDAMQAKGEHIDFVNEVALFYPLRVIMEILGVPREDEPLMLKLTQEIFGTLDPDVIARSQRITREAGMWAGAVAEQVDILQVAQVFFQYFAALMTARRAEPRDDLASVIANGTIDGAQIPDHEALSYYVITATAGHDTTSATAAGAFQRLAESPADLARLKAEPELMGQFIDEAIRWTTPVKHFMRTATQDHELNGKTIREGDGLALFYMSGNRDETVFEHPDEFRLDRNPNRHIAFGHGGHICPGMHLARMELRVLFEELVSRIGSIEPAGEPRLTRANFVSGLKTLPVRVTWA